VKNFCLGSRDAKTVVRAVALPTLTASVKVAFILASGAKGLPFLIPIAANSPTISGSTKVSRSCCTTSFSSSKNLKLLAWTVLNLRPEMFTNFCAGGLAAAERG